MKLPPGVLARIIEILDAPTDHFVELVRIAGLDRATDFRGADLRGVDLRDMDLTGFDLAETDLGGADVRGADLSRTVGLDSARLENVIADSATRWPKELHTAEIEMGGGAKETVAASRFPRAEMGAVKEPHRPPRSKEELLEKVRRLDPTASLSLLEDAYDLAESAYGGDHWINGEPYVMHLLAMADILVDYRLDLSSVAAGLLHGVVEDTSVKLDEITERFGAEIASLVDGVTKLSRLALSSPERREADNFRKLVLALSRDIRVPLVKLADRLHNMRTLGFVRDQERRQRIARETMEIYVPLAERIGMDAMKGELQTLAFRELQPEAYQSVQARLNLLRGQGEDVIEEVRAELTRVCTDAGVAVLEVTGGEKSPFSIWEKMRKRNIELNKLSDIMAFRIVVATREQCYAALGAVHAAYPVIAERFKDYISMPKANGYQSLHTGVTLRQPRNEKIEVQIRTRQMHEVAEAGVAAHWLYKEGRAPAEDLERFRWVQDLLEILENSSTPEEVVENSKLECYEDQVLCFTPKGTLIQLPRGATPIDFAYAVHSQVGDSCVGAKVNGQLKPLVHQLQNGDEVEIMTVRGGTPSPQWDRFVVTGKARARIRHFVHQQQRQKHLDEGRAALTKAFQQNGLDGAEKVLEGTLKVLKLGALDALYVAVGKGSVNARDVVRAAYPKR